MQMQGHKMSLSSTNSSDSLRRELTFDFISTASKSLADLFKASFGPKGTYKMLNLFPNFVGSYLELEKLNLLKMGELC